MKRVDVAASARIGRGVLLEADPGARIAIGAGAVLGEGTRIHARGGTVTVGAGTVLGERCALVAHEQIAIGDRCHLGDGVVITDFEPVTGDVETPVRLQGIRTSAVRVGDGATLGHGACLTAGAAVKAGGSVGVHVVAG